ncbi:MAG: hypothetical protein ACR2RF_00780 [Geminicoccaceae bacterium]
MSNIDRLVLLSSSRWLYRPGLFILLIILAAPLTIDVVPPLLDYPIHLARSYITLEYPNDPLLREIFTIDWRPIPNLASDIILFFLGRFFEIETAGRLLIGFCISLTFLSVIFLHRVNFGYWGWWPLLAVIPAYHGALTAGFINYSIGIALIPAFLAIAKLLNQQKLICRIIAHSIFALILFFCHVISVGLFGIFLLSYECWNIIKNKLISPRTLTYGALTLILPFIWPAILYIKYSLSKIIERETPTIIGIWDFDARLRGVLMPFISGNYLLDFIAFFLFISIFGYLIYYKSLAFCHDYSIGTIIVFMLFLVVPGHMLDAAFISDRLPIAIVLVGIASTNPQRIKKEHAAFFAALVLSVTMTRASSMTMSWMESSRYYLRLNEAVEIIERGASVMILSPMTELRDMGLGFWHGIRMNSPNWHFSLLNIPALHSYAVIPLTKQAVFSQLHFVWADKQILSLKEPYSTLNYGDGGDSTWDPTIILKQSHKDGLAMSNRERFDYFLVVYADRLSRKLRREIESQSPIYVDEEFILLRAPAPTPR